MPPCFGVSAAPAAGGAAPMATPISTAAAPELILIASSCSALFIEPHRRQILVQIMAGADLPARVFRSRASTRVALRNRFHATSYRTDRSPAGPRTGHSSRRRPRVAGIVAHRVAG